MTTHTPSGQQAVDIEAALRWADRHEARERQKLRDMGLPPEGDMPVTGAFFVRGLVAMLRTAAPTAPSTAAGEKTSAVKQMERSPERWANMSPDVVADGSRAQVAYALKDAQHDIALLVAALATPPAQEQAAQIRNDALEEAAERARFKAWAVASGYCVYRHSIHFERYLEDRTNDAFRGWNAALACSAKGEGK